MRHDVEDKETPDPVKAALGMVIAGMVTIIIILGLLVLIKLLIGIIIGGH